jgi:hypothetical protein
MFMQGSGKVRSGGMPSARRTIGGAALKSPRVALKSAEAG